MNSTRLSRTLPCACQVLALTAVAIPLAGSPAVAVTLQLGDIVVSDFNDNATVTRGGRIVKIDPGTGSQTLISENGEIDYPWSLAVETDRKIIVIDKPFQTSPAQVLRINPADGGQTVLSTGGLLVDPTGVCIGNSGYIYVGNSLGSVTGSVLRIDPVTGGQTTVVQSSLLRGISGLTVDTAGYLYANVTPSGGSGLAVMRIDPLGGGLQIVSSTSTGRWFSGIAAADSGKLYSSEIYYSNGILEIDPVTGSQTFISTYGYMSDPWGVAMDLAGNIIVADSGWWGAGSVLRIDPVTHAQTLISSGGLLVDPSGVAVVPEPSAMLLAAGTVPFVLGWAGRRRRLSCDGDERASGGGVFAGVPRV